MIQGQFNCIIVCKTIKESAAVEHFLATQNIDAYTRQFKGRDIVYTVFNLGNREYSALQNFLIQEK